MGRTNILKRHKCLTSGVVMCWTCGAGGPRFERLWPWSTLCLSSEVSPGINFFSYFSAFFWIPENHIIVAGSKTDADRLFKPTVFWRSVVVNDDPLDIIEDIYMCIYAWPKHIQERYILRLNIVNAIASTRQQESSC